MTRLPGTDPQAFLDAGQRAEIERRIAAIEAGTMPVYPWEEVRRRLLTRSANRQRSS